MNHKSPGEDGLPPEIFKGYSDTLVPWLHRVVAKLWEEEMIPEDWSMSIVLPLFKKGDRRACNNYRGISFIDVAAKVFVSLLHRKFQGARDTRIRLSQSGFCPGRGCIDRTFSLCQTLEHCGCFQRPTGVLHRLQSGVRLD